LIFGDYLNDLSELEVVKECMNGSAELQGYRGNKEIWYIIDCDKGKVSGVTISDKAGTTGINMKYSDFKQNGKMIFPEKIMIEDSKGNTRLNIFIGNMEYVTEDNIDFIPGRNYEKIILK